MARHSRRPDHVHLGEHGTAADNMLAQAAENKCDTSAPLEARHGTMPPGASTHLATRNRTRDGGKASTLDSNGKR